MGNDGGTINKVHKLQLSPARDYSQSPTEQDLRQFQEASLWKCCRLTNRKLRLPVVSDSKGYLFNKESILEWLLTPGRETFDGGHMKQFSHIKKLNDVVDLQGLQEKDDSLQCEFSGDILGKSSVKFAYLTVCGDVFPRSSLHLLSKRQCPKCNQSFQELDVITLNPLKPELEELEKRLKRLDALNIHHNGKSKLKKRKKDGKRHLERSAKKAKTLTKHSE